MERNFLISVLGGPVTVAYRKRGRKWYCTALQFDLVGIGRTREDSFNQLRDVMNIYLADVLDADGPVEFFNLSERRDWATKDIETYSVVAIMARVRRKPLIPPVFRRIQDLRRYRNRVQSFDLLHFGA